MSTRFDSEHLSSELATADLKDARRSRRLAQIAAAAVQRPDASFPMMAADESELEGIYRFLNNPAVSPESILEPHHRASVERAQAGGDEILVVHDTTYFKFDGDRDGMGRVHVKDQGFWAHVALAVSARRECFGVVGLRYGTRLGPSRWKGDRKISNEGEDENRRWLDLPIRAAARFGSSNVVHVMDREADWFELMEELVQRQERFVIRLCHDRLVEGGGRISDALERAVAVSVEREVQLSARAEGSNARQKARHPARRTRKATLELRGAAVRIRSSTRPGTLDLHVVHVRELEAPEGCEPVVWNLITTERLETADDLKRVVDIYRARWMIEEYFKALKTGCAFEKRQLGSYTALLNALAVFIPVAWTLLRLRDAGRAAAPPPTPTLLSAAHLQLLRVLAERRRPLPPEPSAKEITYAIAALGGHLPRNGDPGWQTLGRGLERLLEAAKVLGELGIQM